MPYGTGVQCGSTETDIFGLRGCGVALEGLMNQHPFWVLQSEFARCYVMGGRDDRESGYGEGRGIYLGCGSGLGKGNG